MATSSLDQTLNTALTCPVCLELYDDPRTLPCQHIFCLACLSGIMRGDRSVCCPICREIVKVGPRGTASLPRSFLAAGLVGDLIERPVSHAASGHVQEDQREIKRCQEHPTEEIVLFCREESTPICLKCLAQGHENHRFTTVKEVAAERRISLDNCLSDISPLAIAYDKAHEELEDIISTCQNEKDSISQQITNKVESLCSLIRKQGDDLLKNVDEIYADEMEPFFTGRELINRIRDRIGNARQSGEDSIENDSDLDFIEHQPQLFSDLIKLKKETILPPSTAKGFKVTFVPKVVRSFDLEPRTAGLRRKVSPKKTYTTTNLENESNNLTGKLVLSKPSSLKTWMDSASHAVPFVRVRKPHSIAEMLDILGDKGNLQPLANEDIASTSAIAMRRSQSASALLTEQDSEHYDATERRTSQMPIDEFLAAYIHTRDISVGFSQTPNAPESDESWSDG
ncbi:tripartite motif-containing protein 59-like [Lingula anatina]|uniref:Tripartite motif-containing protein 59-like n=1 Tax=Lingula anatina TaxID=7574 RepID=A0A1S3IQP0_LINAN|nr:tripartite motif-containing protein 59-like [Lingula anatina]|eukprot:XP_013400535.1 tripartite motif-containing protein 59-like [Lingula anatina]